MFSRSLTSRILEKVHSLGPKESVITDTNPKSVPSTEAVAYWGNHLASLVESGTVPKAVLNRLAWDAIGGEAGSWLDPLFEGPVPVGELPGLGDRYRDLILVGSGATAQVFKALDTLLLRKVAIKVLKDPSGLALAEARAQAQVEHPNLCRIYEVGKGFIVMQLVEGQTLAQMASSLDLHQKVRILRDVALGVHAAHLKKLLHLDLKLNNVILETDPEGNLQPIIGDFGMVRSDASTHSGSCPMGTPPYTSPEQLTGDATLLSRGSDVYALGVMLYVLLTGTMPFNTHDFQGLLDAIAHAPPVPLRHRLPSLPKDLAMIVHRCLEKKSTNRYSTARDLADDLDRFLRTEPVAAMGQAPLYRFGKWVRRNKNLQWVGGLSLAVVIATASVMTHRAGQISQQAEWDHYFQRTVEELRGNLDQIYRLPAHDIDPDLERAREFIKTIENTIAKGGHPAQGPGYLALGQAFTLLDADGSKAADYFQKAWDMGYKTESVRSWLALTMVERYKSDRRDTLAALDSTMREKEEREVCQRYLEPARRMLEGRGGPDQARLLYQVELAEAVTADNPDFDRMIRLARTFRTQFPNDLDGMLEEARALSWKADDIAIRASRTSTEYPPHCAAQVEPLRRTAGEILRQLLHIAPSHPKVYVALAQWCTRQNNFPTEMTPSPQVLQRQTQTWVDMGMKISRSNLELISQYASFLVSQVLPSRLDQGLDPGPVQKELEKLLHFASHDPAGHGLLAIAFTMAQFTSVCEAHGVQAVDPFVEAVHELARNPVTRKDLHSRTLVLNAAKYLLETGKDPRPCIQEFQQTGNNVSQMECFTDVIFELILAEHATLTGGDASLPLRRAEQRIQQGGLTSEMHDFLDLLLRHNQAAIIGGTPSWSALEVSLGRWEQGAGKNIPDNDQPEAWAAKLAFAKHLLDSGGDARVVMRAMRNSLVEGKAGDSLQNPIIQLHLASLSLLESSLERDPVPRLKEGLAAANRALPSAYLPAHSGSHVRGRTRQSSPIFKFPSLGRTLKLRGELSLALAKQAQTPEVRRSWARKAEASFRDSLVYNRNLQRSLAPLMAQARALSRFSGEPHARS